MAMHFEQSIVCKLADLIIRDLQLLGVHLQDHCLFVAADTFDQGAASKSYDVDGVPFAQGVDECLMAFCQGGAGCELLDLIDQVGGLCAPGVGGVGHG